MADPLFPDAVLRDVIQAAARVIIHAALVVLQGDPHAWSTRPCETCRTVTRLVGEPFGCEVYRAARLL